MTKVEILNTIRETGAFLASTCTEPAFPMVVFS